LPGDPEPELRQAAAALALAALAGFGALNPAGVPHVAAATGPKVVLIVGATHSATASYRADMDSVYAEAIKYTPNVVKVYSPNATWSAVKAAVTGAQIVVYMGHGNGWPSPYTYDPNYTTKDGFGLNATAGNGDYNNTYYGEPYIRTLSFAPNAVVILSHLCYASGNSEPGNAEPTLSVAKQRADNYASAFLAAGARAVIAEGHAAPNYYIGALFTTHQTLDQMWRTAPMYRGHVINFASVRSPGATVEMDPDTTSSGYYRALSGNVNLWTDDAVGAPPTSADPSSLVVPGNASVAVDGAGLYASANVAADSAPSSTLALDTRLRVAAAAGNAADGTPLVQVAGLDADVAGYMRAPDLRPRDSLAPAIRTVDDGPGTFSPNGDGQQDTITLKLGLSESAAWHVTMRATAGGGVLAQATGSGSTATLAWNGLDAGNPVPDGSYTWTIDATDGWNNTMSAASGRVTVDTAAPTLSSLTPAEGTPAATFWPNGDGIADTVAFGFSTTEAGFVDVTVTSAGATVVRRFSATATGGAGTVTWDGRSNAGGYVADGTYVVSIAPRDRAGNAGVPTTRTIGVYGALAKVSASPAVRYPQDLDRLSPTTTLSFTLLRPSTVNWVVRNSSGAEVLRRYTNAALAAGTYAFNWNGRNASGAMVPVGKYRLTVSATNGTLASTVSASFELDAFSIRPSDLTPGRGQSITVTVVSAEALRSTAPLLTISQPGIASWSIRMTHVSGVTYRATIRFKSSATGTVWLRASGYDLDNRYQKSSLPLPLH
jgi:flagellar hook assembly protein FlgD